MARYDSLTPCVTGAPSDLIVHLFLFQLHMIRVTPSMGQMLDMNTLLRHLLFLLEYCMVTGYDWWDVLLHAQPSMVHNLLEKLHEEYMRQNQALQQVDQYTITETLTSNRFLFDFVVFLCFMACDEGFVHTNSGSKGISV